MFGHLYLGLSTPALRPLSKTLVVIIVLFCAHLVVIHHGVSTGQTVHSDAGDLERCRAMLGIHIDIYTAMLGCTVLHNSDAEMRVQRSDVISLCMSPCNAAP